MCRKELALICILIQEVYVKKSFSAHFKCLQPYQVEYTSSRLITSVKQLWAESRHRTFLSDYWLCKIPYKEISFLYLLYGQELLVYIAHVPFFSVIHYIFTKLQKGYFETLPFKFYETLLHLDEIIYSITTYLIFFF